MFASSVQCQQSSPLQQARTAGTESLQDLAKDTLNPFAGVIKVPFQFTTGFGVGGHHRLWGWRGIQVLAGIVNFSQSLLLPGR
jgi:hypothetical protein